MAGLESALLGTLFQQARDITAHSLSAQANKKQCARLAQRSQNVVALLEPLRQQYAVPQYSDAVLVQNLRSLERVLKEALALVSQYSSRNWVGVVFTDAANPNSFDKISRELMAAADQLKLGPSVKNFFNRTDDASDLSGDIQAINEQQEEIVRQYMSLEHNMAGPPAAPDELRRKLAMALSSSKAFVPKSNALVDDTMRSLVEDFIVPWSELRLIKKLGGGAFGEVHLAKWRGIDDVAVKILKSSTTLSMRREIQDGISPAGGAAAFGATSKEDQKAVEEFMNELKLMAKLRHPNIVQLMAVVLEPNRKALIMEYMPAGSLFDVIVKRNLSWPQIISIANDIAKGCAYLIRMGVLHRDLKSGNVMVRDDMSAAKICDFGLSQNMKAKSKDVVGSIRWIAPELFDLTPNTEKSDVFAFGMILYELVSRRLPFHEYNDEQVESFYRRGLRPPIPEKVPKGLASIIEHCWTQDPNKRPTFMQMIEQGWFESSTNQQAQQAAVQPRQQQQYNYQMYQQRQADPMAAQYGRQPHQPMPIQQKRSASGGAGLKIPPRIESKTLLSANSAPAQPVAPAMQQRQPTQYGYPPQGYPPNPQWQMPRQR